MSCSVSAREQGGSLCSIQWKFSSGKMADTYFCYVPFIYKYRYTLKQMLCLLCHFLFIGWLKTWKILVKKFLSLVLPIGELYYRKLILMHEANPFVGSYGGNMASWAMRLLFRAVHSSENHPPLPVRGAGSLCEQWLAEMRKRLFHCPTFISEASKQKWQGMRKKSHISLNS